MDGCFTDKKNETYENHVMAPGTQARLICEWPDLNLGDVVTIIRYDSTQGYLVQTNKHLEEIWVPAHVLSNYNHRKPWSFRFRKPPLRRNIDVNQQQTTTTPPPLPQQQQQYENNKIIDNPLYPKFRDKLKDITVQCGANVVFKCRLMNCNRNTRMYWKRLEPNLCILRGGRLILGQNNECIAMLTLDNVKISDSGIYSLTITNEYGTIQSTSILTVTDSYPPLQEPRIQILASSSVLLKWHSEYYDQFLIEYCKLGTGEWLSPNNNRIITTTNYTIDDLIPGETYSFRLVAVINKLVSLPSIAITLPVADDLRWQQEQFKRRYIELDEINRGRFSIVRLAKDRGTGVEVALKQVIRRKQPHHITQAEYGLLANMQHVNIVRSLALFDNAPLPGLDTIVLELVKGPLLFTYICERSEYSEATVKVFIKQLVSALLWLHNKNISHLDIKPENVMVDLSINTTPVLKLVDFGDSVNTLKNVILPPACLEFASPELVLGQPVGKHTDHWAVGVFLYVLLSGVSPFLDDSLEETTANILKCDYCFPDEYFTEISDEAKTLVRKLLVLVPSQRISMEECLQSDWINQDKQYVNCISSTRLKTFMMRRHPMNVPTTPTYSNEHNIL